MRRTFSVITIILWLSFFVPAQNADAKNPGLARLINRLAAADQKPYQQLQRREITTEQAERKFRKTTKRNYVHLKKIIAKHGFPGFSLVGESGSHNFWMMVQHSDFDVEFQWTVLKLMYEAVKMRDASAQDYAFLTDRVRINSGQEQLYGTQITIADPNKHVLKPVEAPAKLDQRRAEIGLAPIKEYLERSNKIFFELNKDKLKSNKSESRTEPLKPE